MFTSMEEPGEAPKLRSPSHLPVCLSKHRAPASSGSAADRYLEERRLLQGFLLVQAAFRSSNDPRTDGLVHLGSHTSSRMVLALYACKPSLTCLDLLGILVRLLLLG